MPRDGNGDDDEYNDDLASSSARCFGSYSPPWFLRLPAESPVVETNKAQASPAGVSFLIGSCRSIVSRGRKLRAIYN